MSGYLGHLNVKEFDEDGDLIRSTDTTVIPTPAGVVKLLHRPNVAAVELHFADGSSHEFVIPEEGRDEQ
jgi:hypothetical protein